MASSKSHHPKLKPPPRPLFSCAMFRHCTDTPLSPTTAAPPPPPTAASAATTGSVAPTPPPPQGPAPPTTTTARPPPPSTSSSSSSSSSASHSFTQWRFPLHHPQQQPDSQLSPSSHLRYPPLPPDAADPSPSRLAELHFAAGNRLPALRLLERSLAANDTSPPPPSVLSGIVASVLDPTTARTAAKVLLAILLPQPNRRPAVEAGAVSAALEAVMSTLQSPSAGATTAERALAALELMCTVPEGSAEVRARTTAAAAALCGSVERMTGRGRECAIGVLAASYGGPWAEQAPEVVGRAVAAALQGECSARGRRKGLQLLRALKDAGSFEEEVR